LLNTFEAALHSAYLCLNVSALFGVISVFISQKDARNNEQGFALGHKNIHFLKEAPEHYQQQSCSANAKASSEAKSAIEANCETKRVVLDPRVSNKTAFVGKDLSPEEESELLVFLDKDSDVFAWSTSDLIGVSRDIIEHKLQVNPAAKSRKQKLPKMSEEKVTAVKAKVQRLLDASFIREDSYPAWLAQVVMVRKKNGK
jgi:hypothetical protein